MKIRQKIFGPFIGKNKTTNTSSNNTEGEATFKTQLKEVIRQQKDKFKEKKKSTIILYVLCFLLLLYFIGLCTSVIRVFSNLNMNASFFKHGTGAATTSPYHITWLPWEAFLCVFDFKYSLFVILFVLVAIAYLFYWYIKNHIAMGEYTVEERSGAKFKKQLQDATLGSAREMNEEEIAKNFLVLTPKELKENNPNTLIFGRRYQTGNYILEKPVGSLEVPNRNCFVVGDAGSWKTSNFIITNMKQIARRGDNVVCTDSSGEVLAFTYLDFAKQEYDIYVINTTDTDYSDTMNFIGSVGNDMDLAKTVTETLTEATKKPTDRVDVFFEKGMKTLLPAIIVIVNTELRDYSSIEGIINFLIRHDTTEKLEEVFEQYKKKQPEAYKQFRLFKTSPVADNFISNLSQRLDLFVSTGISRICSKDGFDIIKQLGTSERKTVVYLITDKTYAFIGALYLNIFSKILVSHAKKNCPGRVLPHKLFFVFEEFLTMGYVPNMGTFLSENRKFGFVYYLICQAIPQFYRIYDEKEAKEIMSNCTYKFFYGTGDIDTAELFEKYSGPTTVRTAMTAYTNQVIKNKDQAREGVQQRYLFDYYELITLEPEHFILYKTHQHPLKLEKPFYKTLPCNIDNETVEVHYTDYIPHDKREKTEEDTVQSESVVEQSGIKETSELNASPNPDNTSDELKHETKEPESKTDIIIINAEPLANVAQSFSDKQNRTANNKQKKKPLQKQNKRQKAHAAMETQAYGNLIEKLEEFPERRPFENENEVCKVNDVSVFINKRNRKGEPIRAYKVIFKIDITTTQIGGEVPPNCYCTFTTRFNIDTLRDTMKLSQEGKTLIGFRRTRVDNDKNKIQDHYFESDEKEHFIFVPKSDITISPLFRNIPGYSNTFSQNIKL